MQKVIFYLTQKTYKRTTRLAFTKIFVRLYFVRLFLIASYSVFTFYCILNFTYRTKKEYF